jgi:hypothetical protein
MNMTGILQTVRISLGVEFSGLKNMIKKKHPKNRIVLTIAELRVESNRVESMKQKHVMQINITMNTKKISIKLEFVYSYAVSS